MELHPLTSTAIEAAGYSVDARLLRIKFREGKVYDYADVSAELYRRFLQSDSKGRFVRLNLAGRGTEVKPQPEVDRPLHFAEPDDCCGVSLFRAIASGRLDAKESWTHKKCGAEWRSTLRADGTILWTPVTIIKFL